MLRMSTTSSGEATGIIKLTLKKMRGISVSVEFNQSEEVKEITSMEYEILSQELRRAKTASIWTSDLTALEEFAKEQSTAKGSFPGPAPVIYNGGCNVNADVAAAVEKGATAVTVDAMNLVDVDLNMGVDIICRTNSVEEVRTAVEAGLDYAFLLPGNMNNEEIVSMMEEIPKNAVVIASLECMQDDSEEIARGKELAQLVAESSGTKLSGVVVNDACVGDAEDLKYTSFVVESINKKSSSTFAMTGLTGAANGHFGSEVSGGIAKGKWKRKEHQK